MRASVGCLSIVVAVALGCGAQNPGGIGNDDGVDDNGTSDTQDADDSGDDENPGDSPGDNPDETPGDDENPGDDETPDDDVPEDLPNLVSCFGAQAPAGLELADWNHWATSVVVLGAPHHALQDTLVRAGDPAPVGGRFAYGASQADLGDEWVQLWLDDCSGAYVLLGEALTDDDGFFAFDIDTTDMKWGSYALWARVEGDDSGAAARLELLPEGTKLVVLDIDATLTTSDTELAQDLLNDYFLNLFVGDYVPEARAGAKDLTLLRAAQGYRLLYLTGRPYYLADITRDWLATQGMAPGTVRFAPSTLDAAPTETGVGDYKAAYLEGLRDQGFLLSVAYGNASTDIYAYALAGIDPTRTFILGATGGEGGTVALGEDYLQHLDTASMEPPIGQPFE